MRDEPAGGEPAPRGDADLTHVRAMWADDRASAHLGMEALTLEVDHAVVRMTVGEHMVNGHGTAHGGFLFTLADSAFGLVCNSRGQSPQPPAFRPPSEHAAVLLRHLVSPRHRVRLVVHRHPYLLKPWRARASRRLEAPVYPMERSSLDIRPGHARDRDAPHKGARKYLCLRHVEAHGRAGRRTAECPQIPR